MNWSPLRLLPQAITILFFCSLFFQINTIYATSGCCSGHDGVSCSAGPQSNGRVICNDGWRGSSCSYASMVMCGGSSYSAAPATPKPTPVPTAKPTPIQTIKPTSSPTQAPTASPEVLSATDAPQQPAETIVPQVDSMTLEKKDASAGSILLGFLILAGMVYTPIWVAKKLWRKIRR